MIDKGGEDPSEDFVSACKTAAVEEYYDRARRSRGSGRRVDV